MNLTRVIFGDYDNSFSSPETIYKSEDEEFIQILEGEALFSAIAVGGSAVLIPLAPALNQNSRPYYSTFTVNFRDHQTVNPQKRSAGLYSTFLDLYTRYGALNPLADLHTYEKRIYGFQKVFSQSTRGVCVVNGRHPAQQLLWNPDA